MIYKTEAAFSYPILANNNDSYVENEFNLEIKELSDDNNNYIIRFEYNIKSSFINHLLETNKAKLLFIIQSDDNYFDLINLSVKEIKLPKRKLSLSKKSTIQMHIIAKDTISFDSNNELNSFYNEYKSEIFIIKNMLLGYSNTVKFQGSENKPLTLIEKRIDPSLKSAFAIELSPATIILSFRDERFQLNHLYVRSSIINMYIYQGLSRALSQFVKDNIGDMDTVDIDSLQGEQENELNQKLLDLMIHKGVREINYENIDEVISKISNNIIEKYVNTLEEVSCYGD